MALGNNDITTTLVGDAIGNASRNVGVLCIAPTINVWSRYRPGFFNGLFNVLNYNAPDGVTTDPRGIDPQTGSDILGYKLGDFRGYNHQAITPGFNQPVDLEYGSISAGDAVSRGITFNFGEFDWRGEDVAFRAGNTLLEPTHLYLLNSANAVKASAIFQASILNGYQTLDYEFTVPNVGVTTTFTAKAATGDSTKFNIRVGNTKGATGEVTFDVRTKVPTQINYPAYSNVGIQADYSSCETHPDATVTRTIDATTFSFRYDTLTTWSFIGYLSAGGTTDHIRIVAKWELSGFQGTTTKYLISDSKTMHGNGANNIVTLPVGGSPSTFSDDDNMTLTLSNISFI